MKKLIGEHLRGVAELGKELLRLFSYAAGHDDGYKIGKQMGYADGVDEGVELGMTHVLVSLKKWAESKADPLAGKIIRRAVVELGLVEDCDGKAVVNPAGAGPKPVARA